MTTTALSRSRFPSSPSPRWRAALLAFSLTLLLGVLVLAGASLGVALGNESKVMPHVTVAGIELGGLDRAAAADRLRSSLPSLSSGSLTVEVDGKATAIGYERLGRGYDTDTMLDAAFGVARDGSPLSDGIARLRALFNGTQVPVAVHAYDDTALEAFVSDVSRSIARESVDASVALDDGSFIVTPAHDGATLDAVTLRTRLAALLATSDAANARISVASISIPAAVGTAEAEAAATAANEVAARRLKLTDGHAGTVAALRPRQLAGLVTFETTDDGYRATIDSAAARHLLKKLAPDLAVAPRNATFAWGATGITGVNPAVDGRELDLAASTDTVVEALEARAAGATSPGAKLDFSVTPAPLTTAEARAAAPKMRRLGTWTTHYVPGENNYWGANISIPARDLDGYVVAPGQWFSFWNGIGPVSTARGYGYGGVIINGRSYQTGALAGGICSTSTTLFNAAMRSGLEIGERTNHSYYIDRYPVGLDATVLRTDTSVTDMTFRNDTQHPIVIRSYTGTGFVRFDVWGVPDGRTVSLSAPVTSNHVAAGSTVVVNRSLKPGTSRVVEGAHDGFNAVVSRTVRDAAGNVIHADVWRSFYHVVNSVTEVGPKR